MRHTALCIAAGLSRTRVIFRELRRCGFTADEIALVAVHCPACASGPASAPAPRIATDIQRWCNLAGTAAGAIAGLEAAALPGIGTAIGRGPLVRALADPSRAGGDPGLGAALGTVGIPDEEARWISAHFRIGTILISVTTANGYEIETVLQIYQEAGALCLAQASDPGEAATPALPPPGQGWAVVPQAAVLAERARRPA
jgi:hypothetical protein